MEVLYAGDTFWLSLKRMAELFGVEVPAVSKHLANIYESGELDQEATVSILETVQQEGNRNVTRKMEFYNLDDILVVGYSATNAGAPLFI